MIHFILLALCAPLWSQSFDFDRGGVLEVPKLPAPSFQFADANHTPETEMIKQVKPAIIDILVVVRWADVKDEFLPIDEEKLPPEIRALLGMMSEDDIRALETKSKKRLPRVSRASLPGYSAVASGTGFLIDAPDGRVIGVTNAHVVKGQDAVSKKMHAPASLHVKLADDPYSTVVSAEDIRAEVGAVGKNGMDVAFLKLPSEWKWRTLRLADSAQVEEGEEVWAMGYPMGLAFTTTRGIVSAVHVTLDNPYVSYIQTDAAINPGNSGGPLIHMTEDKKPEVIAMNTQIMTESGGSQGLGFAIEANTIKRALAQYLRTGSIDVGYVGVEFAPGKGGVAITTVQPGSPADKAGVKKGDVVKSVGGKALSANSEIAMFQFTQAIKAQDPGQTLEMTLARVGREVKVSISVEKEPETLKGKAKAAEFGD